MPGKRILPDLVMMALAFLAGRSLLRLLPGRVFHNLGRASLALIGAGLVVILFQGAGSEIGYRWMMVGGIAFAWAAIVVGAVVVGSIARKADVSPQRRELITVAAMAAPALSNWWRPNRRGAGKSIRPLSS